KINVIHTKTLVELCIVFCPVRRYNETQEQTWEGKSMLTLDMVREAQEALRGIARRTPLDRAPKFGENVYIKAENLQLTGAFKLRGAYNKIRSLTPEEAARGVIACSAGNHAQGIALSASRLGIKAVICMPAGAPIS